MNLYFLKFDENFLFHSKLPWKALLMTLPLDNSTMAYKKEEPYIFCHDSCEWKTDLELWGLGWKDRGESGFTLCGVFIVDFEHILHLFLVFLLLTLTK